MVSNAATALRKRIADPRSGLIVCPGVYDGLSARVALDVGFDTLYMTGAGTAISRLGMPDLGLVTPHDMASNAGMLASLDRSVPVIADADTGYGAPLMVARTVEAYVLAGVAALHIEDQPLSKRCGHLAKSKQVVETSVFLSRIRAAAAARQNLRSDIVLIARSDALHVEGHGFDDAVARLKAAVENGADVAFLEGVRSEEEMKKFIEALSPTPCLLNLVPGGLTPNLSAEQAQTIGYKLAIWPLMSLTASYLAMRDAARELKTTGTVVDTRDEDGDVRGGVRELFEACGLEQCAQFDRNCGGVDYENGV